MWPQASYPPSLCLSVLTYKMGMVIFSRVVIGENEFLFVLFL